MSLSSKLGTCIITWDYFWTIWSYRNLEFTNFSYEHRFGSFFYVHVTREKLPKQRSYEKYAHIMLIKLTPTLFFAPMNQNLRAIAQQSLHMQEPIL